MSRSSGRSFAPGGRRLQAAVQAYITLSISAPSLVTLWRSTP